MLGRSNEAGIQRVADDVVLPAGEMRRRVREHDWSATPLGPRESWPEGLKFVVELVLAAGFPMSVRWGPELVSIYNDAYRVILGDKHPRALGAPLRDVWPEIYDELGPLNEKILRGERGTFAAVDHPWTIQRHGALREQARFTISYSPIPDRDAASAVGGVLVTAVETTERVRDEENLRKLTDALEVEVENRTRERDRIWQVSEDLFGISTFEGYFTNINPAWTHLLGWSEDEIKRMHVSMLRHPDDAAAAIAGRARLAEGSHSVRLENRFRHRDGSWRWIAWTMTADEGRIYVAGRHITSDKETAKALQESERQFRLLVAGVTDHALIMLDPNGIVSSWNTGAMRIKGYTEREIVGQHFSRFYTEEDRAAGTPAKAIATAASTGKYESENWRVRKDGSRFWAHVVIDTIHDETGALIGFAKITRDITERKQAQAALEVAQKQLAQAQKMEALGQLTGGVAHDFNNLLMVVSGHAQSLRRRVTDAKDVRALEAIQTAAARGESLTRQLLAFSRRQPLHPTVISPARSIDAFREIMAGSKRGDIDLQVEIPEDTWAVSVDVSEFELALLNLVVNAQDAMPNGGAITILARNTYLQPHATAEHLSGDFVALSIRDNGSGIPPDALPKVFEPFFTTKGADKGTGLGLSQVYGFARQSGGTVAITTQVDHGTEVTIYLPRSNAPMAAPLRDDSLQAARGDETILVVEDNQEVRSVAISLLEQLGYRVVSRDTAAAALDLLASGQPVDLLFTDVVLSGDLDGLDLARNVRRDYPHIPILLTSGYAKVLNAAHGYPVLRKPYQMAALSRIVRNVIDHATAEADAESAGNLNERRAAGA